MSIWKAYDPIPAYSTGKVRRFKDGLAQTGPMPVINDTSVAFADDGVVAVIDNPGGLTVAQPGSGAGVDVINPYAIEQRAREARQQAMVDESHRQRAEHYAAFEKTLANPPADVGMARLVRILSRVLNSEAQHPNDLTWLSAYSRMHPPHDPIPTESR